MSHTIEIPPCMDLIFNPNERYTEIINFQIWFYYAFIDISILVYASHKFCWLILFYFFILLIFWLILDLIFNRISPDMLIVRSEKLPTQLQNYKDKYPKIKILQLPYESSIQEMVREFSRLDGYYIVAIGNMVGWGEQFIQELKKYRI